jgi:hypothetical protein
MRAHLTPHAALLTYTCKEQCIYATHVLRGAAGGKARGTPRPGAAEASLTSSSSAEEGKAAFMATVTAEGSQGKAVLKKLDRLA